MAKERTPEEQAARKANSKAKRAAKRKALELLREFVAGRKNVPDEVQIASKLLTPGQRIGMGGPSRLDVFADMFTNKDRVSEMDIFTEFKIGRGEMRKVRVNLIKKRKPEDRIWVDHNVQDEAYLVVGFGPEAPSGWTGYRPVEVEDTEIV